MTLKVNFQIQEYIFRSFLEKSFLKNLSLEEHFIFIWFRSFGSLLFYLSFGHPAAIFLFTENPFETASFLTFSFQKRKKKNQTGSSDEILQWFHFRSRFQQEFWSNRNRKGWKKRADSASGMSELAAAGAALLAAVSNPNPCVKSSTPILNIQDCQKELLENQDITETNKTESSLNFLQNKNKPKQLQISNLAVPENDSISSSEDENDDLKEASETLTANDNRAKTLQPQSSLTAPSSSFSSNLKRSFTFPRHPLFNLTNNSEFWRIYVK